MTFLYKLQPGACPKSYGMHVASMANIQQNVSTTDKLRASSSHLIFYLQIIQRADEMSAKFEEIVANRWVLAWPIAFKNRGLILNYCRRKKQQQKKEETFAQLLQATPNAASNHQLILSLWRDCKKVVV